MGLLSSLGAGLKSFATPDNLSLIGAGLKDLGDPDANNLARVTQMLRQRRAEQGLLAALGNPMSDAGGISQAMPVPKDGAYHGMGTGEDGAPLAAPAAKAASQGPSPMTLSAALPALLKAKAAGADIGDYVSLLSAMQPKAGISGDVPYSMTPDGKVSWGEQRPMTQREKMEQERQADLEAYRAAEQARRDRQLEALINYRGGQLDIGRGRLGLAQKKEGRIATGKAGKGASGGYGGGVGPAPGDWR